MKFSSNDFFPHTKFTQPLLPYEVRGSNQSSLACSASDPGTAIDQFLICFASSPGAAIGQFSEAFPDEEFSSIQCLQLQAQQENVWRGHWVATTEGDRVMILRSRLINKTPHYETSLEVGAWFPASEFAQVMEAVAA
ncbi:MAG: hypothetical protein KME43_21435 [Myxacorys chilensis ATA2-1-KO14]|jgi:hypothetical protein|nr:hypothetical protein [Myxacorys chilensis ATA2-1-KO14]